MKPPAHSDDIEVITDSKQSAVNLEALDADQENEEYDEEEDEEAEQPSETALPTPKLNSSEESKSAEK